MNKEGRAQQMYGLVEQWEQSGESQKSFAEQHQVNLHTFRYWIDKKRKSENTSSGFVRLTGIIGDNISLRYPNGVELLLPASVSVSCSRDLSTCRS